MDVGVGVGGVVAIIDSFVVVTKVITVGNFVIFVIGVNVIDSYTGTDRDASTTFDSNFGSAENGL